MGKKYKKKKKFRQSENSLCRFFMHQCTKMITKRTFSVRDSSLSVCICSRGVLQVKLRKSCLICNNNYIRMHLQNGCRYMRSNRAAESIIKNLCLFIPAHDK